MPTIEIKLKTVTPLFLGGAEPNSHAELRPPSIKGALRFWYRAVCPEYNTEYPHNGDKEKGRTWEETIFGSSKYGQGIFILRLRPQKIITKQYPIENNQGLSYLGYGAIVRPSKKDNHKNHNHYYVEPETGFTIILQYKARDQDLMDWVIKAFKALVLFGGLGARSRRGFGTLEPVKLADWNGRPNSIEKLNSRCKEVIGSIEDLPKNLPAYTAFSQESCYCLYERSNCNSWQNPLSWIGGCLNNYRSWKKDKCFPDDHAIFYDVMDGKDPQRSTSRHIFGLPHNYYSNNKGSMAVEAFQVTKENDGVIEEGKPIDRRASPFFIRVHPLATQNTFVVLLALFPATFLPENSRLHYKGNNNSFDVTPEYKWKAIKDFMNSYVGSKQ